MDLLFLQTGGTIDKDYPKTQGRYSFEIADPEVERILERVNPSFE
jgi:L-asparaginase